MREVVLGLGLHERSMQREGGHARGSRARARPYVLLNMVATLDGRATLQGRSGLLSSPADRALFHGLRSVVDGVLAGAATVRQERYGPIVPDPDNRRSRVELGLRERPLACVISASLAFPPDQPLLADPDSEVAILTPSEATLSVDAQLEYVRAPAADGSLDLAAALEVLHERLRIGTLLCEGGPHLNGELLALGLVDELFLSVSPLLAGEEPSDAGAALRILAGVELDPPRRLGLVSALECNSQLFLRYRVQAGG